MSDDDLLSQIIANAERVAADARRIQRDHSLRAQVRAGNVLSLKEAAYAAQCSDETIRRECVRTRGKKAALGFHHQGRWFVDKTRLLDWIGLREEKGLSKRRIAEERLGMHAPRGAGVHPSEHALR